MKNSLLATTLIGAFVFVSLVGCDMRPRPPRTHNRALPKVLYINKTNDAERDAVVAVETARIEYRHRLELLKESLLQRGYMDEHNWAKMELNNLEKSVTFKWGNLPELPPRNVDTIPLADSRSLVEDTVAARKTYLEAVDKLAQLYESSDPESYKARRIRNMQARFFPEETYTYFTEAEIPGPELRPVDLIPEAERLYKQALKLHRWGQLGPGITNYRKQREALRLFLRLIREHPSSTKIALSAFHIAQIYKEYFQEYVLAVQWYERAWQWDPMLPEAARFEAAVVYDIALHNFTKAAELYRASLLHDPPRLGNAGFAKRRVQELIEQGKIPALLPQQHEAPDQ